MFQTEGFPVQYEIVAMQQISKTLNEEDIMQNFETVAKAHKEHVEAALNLGQAGFDAYEKTVNATVQTLRAAGDESTKAFVQTLEARDPQILSASLLSATKPQIEAGVGYLQKVGEAYTTFASIAGKIAEARYAAATQYANSLVDLVSKNVPAGGDHFSGAMKNTMSSFTNMVDVLQKSAKQTADMVNANMTNATSALQPAAAKAGKKA